MCSCACCYVSICMRMRRCAKQLGGTGTCKFAAPDCTGSVVVEAAELQRRCGQRCLLDMYMARFLEQVRPDHQFYTEHDILELSDCAHGMDWPPARAYILALTMHTHVQFVTQRRAFSVRGRACYGSAGAHARTWLPFPKESRARGQSSSSAAIDVSAFILFDRRSRCTCAAPVRVDMCGRNAPRSQALAARRDFLKLRRSPRPLPGVS